MTGPLERLLDEYEDALDAYRLSRTKRACTIAHVNLRTALRAADEAARIQRELGVTTNVDVARLTRERDEARTESAKRLAIGHGFEGRALDLRAENERLRAALKKLATRAQVYLNGVWHASKGAVRGPELRQMRDALHVAVNEADALATPAKEPGT